MFFFIFHNLPKLLNVFLYKCFLPLYIYIIIVILEYESLILSPDSNVTSALYIIDF